MTKLATVTTDIGATLILVADNATGNLSWSLDGYPRSKVRLAREQLREAQRWARWEDLPEDAQGPSDPAAYLAAFVAMRVGGTFAVETHPLPQRVDSGDVVY